MLHLSFAPSPHVRATQTAESVKAASYGASAARSCPGKDAHLPTFSQKRQRPLQHGEESVREPDQEIDVHERPDNPSRKSGEAEHAKIGERIRTPRDREIAFVPVPKGRRRRLSCQASSNQRCHVP